MAGVKGKSGGARPNSGGARPGAGRKPKKPVTPVAPAQAVTTTLEPQPHGGSLVRNAAEPVVQQADMDMLELLKNIALGLTNASPLQVRAAIAAVQYTHTKRENGGKRDEQQGKAEKVAGGRFKAAAPPKLVVSNGR